MFILHHPFHLGLIKAGGEAHAQQDDDHQHQAHGRAKVQVVGIAQELQLNQIANQQVGAAAQHTADDKGRDRRHEHLGDAGGNAGAGQRNQHAEQDLPDVAAQVLCSLDDRVVDLRHGRVDGQDHKRQGSCTPCPAPLRRRCWIMLVGSEAEQAKKLVDEAVLLQQSHPRIGTQQKVHPHGQHDQHEHDMLLVGTQAGEKIANGKRHDQADGRGHGSQNQTAHENAGVAANLGQGYPA